VADGDATLVDDVVGILVGLAEQDPADVEHVEVVSLPAHRLLQVPSELRQRRLGTDHDPPPHLALDVPQRDPDRVGGGPERDHVASLRPVVPGHWTKHLTLTTSIPPIDR
jgi:hypothetical protein